MPRILTSFVLAALLVENAGAQEAAHEYVPASFTGKEDAAIAKIQFPPGDEDVSITVNCDVYVEEDGDFTFSVCWANDDKGNRFFNAVTKNIDSLRINPAQVDGEPVPVYFQYSVVFARSNGAESIRVYPHQFFNAEFYGNNYSEAQRYIHARNRETVVGGCDRRSYSMWVAMIIPETGGHPEDPQIVKQEADGSSCARQILNTVSEGRYIPAFHDGKAVQSRYREIWANTFRK